ncbi:MAG: hypothetical protein EXS08_05855 [Planctomycetes bacterium]|nr:hypothetical protein [Planctomycetota bacterium]
MKFQHSLALLPLFALSFAPVFRAQDPRPRGEHQEHETELGQHMEKLEDTLKGLRKSMKDPATLPAALSALAEIESLTLQCKLLTPEAAAKLPEAERAAFVTAYRRQMVDFLTHQLELEGALLDGDPAKVKAAFDKLREMEDPSHERFAPEEGD